VLKDEGTIFLTFRAAENNVHRDTYLLISNDGARSFRSRLVDRWKVRGCPTTTYSFTESLGRVFFSWENKGQVFFAKAEDAEEILPLAPTGEARKRKFPILASNEEGEILMAWTEGADYRQGGDLAWQLFDKDGNPTDERGRLEGGARPAGMPAAYASSDGRFVVFY
jgi:hypothetical protein